MLSCSPNAKGWDGLKAPLLSLLLVLVADLGFMVGLTVEAHPIPRLQLDFESFSCLLLRPTGF